MDLEKLEHVKLGEEIPLLDTLYVVVDNEEHDSGYKFLKVYGFNKRLGFAKRITNYSDVIHFYFDVKDILKLNFLSVFSVDSEKPNETRYFARGGYKFEIDSIPLSDCFIKIVEEEK